MESHGNCPYWDIGPDKEVKTVSKHGNWNHHRTICSVYRSVI